jgi:hypothetical protein
VNNPEEKNYAEIERLEHLLAELRANRSTARETEAIREVGWRWRWPCAKSARC